MTLFYQFQCKLQFRYMKLQILLSNIKFKIHSQMFFLQ